LLLKGINNITDVHIWLYSWRFRQYFKL